MEAFLVSSLVVALAEIGDKTQLLAIVLATQFRKPIPIIAGIFAATIANHALAALAGYFLTDVLSGAWFRYAIAISFIAMALWALVPDKCDDVEDSRARAGVFLTTFVAFFLVEIGDKTQVATAALAAKFQNVELVTAGTTIGMMLANVPAVYLGESATKVIPLQHVRFGAAMIFLALGVWGIADVAGLNEQLATWEIPNSIWLSAATAVILALNVVTYVLRLQDGSTASAPLIFRRAASIGLFKFLGPLSGWAIGFAIASTVRPVDHWIAFFLLGGLGLHILWSASKMDIASVEYEPQAIPLLAVDALVVGLIVGLLGEPIIHTALMLGLLSFCLAAIVELSRLKQTSRLCYMPQLLSGMCIAIAGGVVLYLHTVIG